jgi:hypothetical protein
MKKHSRDQLESLLCASHEKDKEKPELVSWFLLVVQSDQYTEDRIICTSYEEAAQAGKEALDFGALSITIFKQ